LLRAATNRVRRTSGANGVCRDFAHLAMRADVAISTYFGNANLTRLTVVTWTWEAGQTRRQPEPTEFGCHDWRLLPGLFVAAKF
jgi:hypothetical protein